MSIEIINEKNFSEKVLQNDKFVIVDFFAIWCGPCKMLAPVFEEVAKIKTEMQFYKIDVDNSSDLAIKYEVEFVPTMIVFKDGKEVTRIGGATDEQNLLAELNKITQ